MAGAGAWVALPHLLTTKRGGVAACAVGGKLYAVGGRDSPESASCLCTADVYDLAAPDRGWVALQHLLATPRFTAAACAVGGKLYIVGGCTNCSKRSALRTAEVYDPAAPDRGWVTLPHLFAKPRGGVAACAVSGKLYAVGGNNESATYLRTVEVYDPAVLDRGWVALPCLLATPRSGAGACTAGGKLYVVGGSDGATYLRTVEVYDPAVPDRGWVALPHLLTAPRGRVAAYAVGGKLYVIGGCDGATYLRTVEVYDPAALDRGWIALPHLLATPRSGVAACAVGGKLYAIGGYDGATRVRTTEVLDVASIGAAVPPRPALSAEPRIGSTVSQMEAWAVAAEAAAVAHRGALKDRQEGLSAARGALRECAAADADTETARLRADADTETARLWAECERRAVVVAAECERRVAVVAAEALAAAAGHDGEFEAAVAAAEPAKQWITATVARAVQVRRYAAVLGGDAAAAGAGAAAPASKRRRLRPAEHVCPITLDVMADPAMVVPCGHTFERAAIEAAITAGRTVCPVCNTPLSPPQAFPNVAVCSMIREWPGGE